MAFTSDGKVKKIINGAQEAQKANRQVYVAVLLVSSLSDGPVTFAAEAIEQTENLGWVLQFQTYASDKMFLTFRRRL